MTIWTRRKEEQFYAEASRAIKAQVRAMELPIGAAGQSQAQWTELTYGDLAREGYKANALIFACVTAWILAMREAPIRIVDESGVALDDHPANQVLRRPNPYMSWSDLLGITVLFRMLGGECYLHKVRDGYGQVVELYPYHAGLIRPVSGTDENGNPQWISYYEYKNRNAKPRRIETADIITLKWFSPDPEQPWTSYPPIYAIAREMDTDIELTRMVKAFVQNDAMPRTALLIPPPTGTEAYASQGFKEKVKSKFKELFGGDQRGDVTVLQGMDIKRLSLDFKELDIRGISARPEARVCTVLRTPIEIMGFNAGLDKSTYANKQTARKIWHEDSISPAWKADADALTHGLLSEYPKYRTRARIEYDERNIAAYRENDDTRNDRAVSRWQANLCTLNEGRELCGLTPLPDGDVFFKEFVGTAPIIQPKLKTPTAEPSKNDNEETDAT